MAENSAGLDFLAGVRIVDFTQFETGPSLGAFLVAHAIWRAVVWVNVPIGVAAAVVQAEFCNARMIPC